PNRPRMCTPFLPCSRRSGSASSRTAGRSVGSVVLAAGSMLCRNIAVGGVERSLRSERRSENAIDPGLLGGRRRETEQRNAPLYSPEGPEQDGVALRVRCTDRSPLNVSQPESCLLEDVRRLGEERSDAVGRSRRFPQERSEERR